MTLEKNANHIWVTPEGRTSFFNVYTARPNKLKTGALYYDFVLLFPKTGDAVKSFRNIAVSLSQRVFGTSVPPRAILPGEPKSGSNDKPVFKDGDAMYAQKPDSYEAYKGMWILQLSSPQEQRVLIQDENRQEVLDAADFQAGDYGFASIEVSVYRSPVHGPQLSLKPKVVRKTREGEHFGGGVSTAEAEAAMDNSAGPYVNGPAQKRSLL